MARTRPVIDQLAFTPQMFDALSSRAQAATRLSRRHIPLLYLSQWGVV